MRHNLAVLAIVLFSADVLATNDCPDLLGENEKSKVVSLADHRKKAEAKNQDLSRKEGGQGWPFVDQFEIQREFKIVEDFLFDATTARAGFLFRSTHGQLKNRNVGVWPVSFYIRIDRERYSRILIRPDDSDPSVAWRLQKNMPPGFYPKAEIRPGTYGIVDSPDTVTTRILSASKRMLSLEIFHNQSQHYRTVTFIKNNDGVLQEIRFFYAPDQTLDESLSREARFLIEGADPELIPF